MDDPTTDDNPLTVDEAMALIGKWETHPGLLLAVFDAARKLRDEVELLQGELQRSNDWGNAVKAELQSTQRRRDEYRTIAVEALQQNGALRTELEQLRAVVASNNQSIAGIVLSWITPSRN
jgi:Rad3-related DNA helicase